MTTAPDSLPTFRDAAFTVQRETLARLLADFARRDWTPATSSNFSFRLGRDHCAVTASGGDKATLRDEDLLVVALDGRVVDGAPDRRPSAEADLHLALYRRDANVGAVLHTHAPRALLAARLLPPRPLRLAGYELLKAFEDVSTHEAELAVPVVANDQDTERLAAAADAALDSAPGAWAYLIDGHGVYAWGPDLATAARHLEALDYLLGVELELARLTGTR